MFNVEAVVSKKKKTKSKKKPQELATLKLLKSLDDFCPKKVLRDALSFIEKDRIYFIGSLASQRRAELTSLISLIKENFVLTHIIVIVRELHTILSSCLSCTFISEGKKAIWRNL